jgi:solute carrier family 35 protein F5
MYKKFIGEPSYATINLQSGLVGIINLAFLWPIFIILHYSGAEVFRWPRDIAIEMVITTSVLVFINNYLFTFGVDWRFCFVLCV